MRASPIQGSTNRKGERGTTLTEAAFVSIPFLFIIFGIMEMGFLFRNYLTITNTAAEAARSASVSGSDSDADFYILRSAEHGVAAMGVEAIDYLVIWRASGPSDVVPPSCLPGASQGERAEVAGVHPTYDASLPECNVFTYRDGDFNRNLKEDTNGDGNKTPTDYFGCVSEAVNLDKYWCPTDRQDGLTSNGGGTDGVGTDYVGIYVQANHRFLTGFFQNETTLSATKISRIEPEGGQ